MDKGRVRHSKHQDQYGPGPRNLQGRLGNGKMPAWLEEELALRLSREGRFRVRGVGLGGV